MTATKAPPPDAGFVATLATHTNNVFWGHYDKLLTALCAAFIGWLSVYGTAWIGALPQPPAPKPPTEAQRLPALDTQFAGRLDAIDAALKGVRADIAAARGDMARAATERSAKRIASPPATK